jgi:capsular exopolysaccharide synthesis family protein
MTRIFEALKKAQAARPAPEPPSLVPPAPAPRAAAMPAMVRAAEPRLAGPEPVALPSVPEDIVLELTHLRYALESALAGKTCRVVAICSARPREGTSTVSCYLARVLSMDDAMRVLLVDCHLRRPGLGVVLGVRGEATLRDVLCGRADLGRSLAAVERRNLRALCSRPDPERTGAPFPLAELREFLAAVGGAYDWVILDTAPVLASADAAAVAALADAAVLVLRAGHAKRPVVARAAEVLREAGGRVLGSVLNRRRMEIPEFIYRRI